MVLLLHSLPLLFFGALLEGEVYAGVTRFLCVAPRLIHESITNPIKKLLNGVAGIHKVQVGEFDRVCLCFGGYIFELLRILLVRIHNGPIVNFISLFYEVM